MKTFSSATAYFSRFSPGFTVTAASTALLGMISSSPVQAHVKWFADWSVIMCPPRDPLRVLSMPLWQAFFVAAILVIAALAYLDASLAVPGGRVRSAIQRMHDHAFPHAMLALRVGLSLYWLMVALTLRTPVYLTPELSAPEGVRWLQVACAIAVLFNSTNWLAGVGMIALFAMATYEHGWFHLMDYPLFLGIGIVLLLPKLRRRKDDQLSLNLLRWSAALTLLWGGIEKFAFPEWSFVMMNKTPVLNLGVSAEHAMYMYGFGEMVMSFGLMFFGTGSQVSALLLLIVFLVAVLPFGWIDFVGHSGIVVTLVLLMLTRPSRPLIRSSLRGNALLHGLSFPGVVLGLWGFYFGMHSLFMHTLMANPDNDRQDRTARAAVRLLQADNQPKQPL